MVTIKYSAPFATRITGRIVAEEEAGAGGKDKDEEEQEGKGHRTHTDASKSNRTDGMCTI